MSAHKVDCPDSGNVEPKCSIVELESPNSDNVVLDSPAINVVQKNHEELVEDGKNKLEVKCKYCGSKILEKNAGAFVTKEVPPFLKKCTTGDIQHDSFKYCWQVQDCYGFENISVTLGVENMKLLFCCDCDKGPVGYQDLDTKLCYVGISTVAHV